MQNSLAPSLDLSGKLIIKVALGDDIRRIPIHNEDITYDELVLMMQRVYRGKLSTNDDIIIKYKDEDGDLITIFDSSDLTFAIQCSRILKITLFVNGVQPAGFGDVGTLRKELQMVRDRINGILDHINPLPSPGSREPAVPDSTSLDSGVKEVGTGFADRSVARPAEGKEFDPLSTQRSISHEDNAQTKVMSSFGISGEGAMTAAPTDRAGAATPDSLSSIGSASSSQQRQQQQPQPGGGVPGMPQVSQDQQQPQPPVSAPYTQGAGHQAYTGQMPGAYGQPGAPTGQPPQPQQYGQPAAPTGQTAQPPSQLGQQYHGYAQPGQAGYGHYPPAQQQQQQQPQQAQQQQPQQPQGMYSQPGGPQQQAPGQPQPQPQMYPGGQWNMQAPGQQKFPGFPSPAGPGQQQQAPSPTPPGANPYSRGPGYGAGYPRPAANYQQGYQ